MELHDGLVPCFAAQCERRSKFDAAAVGGGGRIESSVIATQQRSLRRFEAGREKDLTARLAIPEGRETEPAGLARKQHEVRLPVSIDVLRGELTEDLVLAEERAGAGDREILQGDRLARTREYRRVDRARSIDHVDRTGIGQHLRPKRIS